MHALKFPEILGILACRHPFRVLAIAVLLVATLCLVIDYLSYWTERESSTTQRNTLKFQGFLEILAHAQTVCTGLSFRVRKEPGGRG